MNPEDILGEAMRPPMSAAELSELIKAQASGSARTAAAEPGGFPHGWWAATASDRHSPLTPEGFRELFETTLTSAADESEVTARAVAAVARGTLPPPWVQTSVRWLREMHPEFLRGASVRQPFIEQLITALKNMAFRAYTSEVDFEATAWAWDKRLHEQMAAWISDGHPERVKRERAKEASEMKKSLARETRAEPVFVGDERIDLEGEDADLLDSVVGALKPPSQLSPEHELQEAVNTALRQEDKRYGSW